MADWHTVFTFYHIMVLLALLLHIMCLLENILGCFSISLFYTMPNL